MLHYIKQEPGTRMRTAAMERFPHIQLCHYYINSYYNLTLFIGFKALPLLTVPE
jgi:hypothetical protein